MFGLRVNYLNFDKVYICEPHSDVSTALLNRCSPIGIIDKIYKSVLNCVNFNDETDYIYFPDTTAQKRYEKFFKGFNTLTAYKERDFETVSVLGHSVMDATGAGFKAEISAGTLWTNSLRQ